MNEYRLLMDIVFCAMLNLLNTLFVFHNIKCRFTDRCIVTFATNLVSCKKESNDQTVVTFLPKRQIFLNVSTSFSSQYFPRIFNLFFTSVWSIINFLHVHTSHADTDVWIVRSSVQDHSSYTNAIIYYSASTFIDFK